VFPKLGITSRRQLRSAVPEEGRPVAIGSKRRAPLVASPACVILEVDAPSVSEALRFWTKSSVAPLWERHWHCLVRQLAVESARRGSFQPGRTKWHV
jgi:hypothetical protein